MHFSNNPGRSLLQAAGALLLALLLPAACTTKDDTVGSNLIPDTQQLKAGYLSLPGLKETSPRKYVETRLFQTDSIASANLGTGYLGMTYNDTLGLRSAGFLSQYCLFTSMKEGALGYRPIFDSAQIILTLTDYGADTVTEQSFGVYEVISNRYLTEKPIAAGATERDTVFYLGFDPEQIDYLPGERTVGEKLFDFKLGGGRKVTGAATLVPTAAGREFVSRLLLLSGDYKGDYSLYDSLQMARWFETFKGVYIKPETDASAWKGSAVTKGSIYGTKLEESGFVLYGRNRMEEDPSLIKDTISLVYGFYRTTIDCGNVSVNTVRHDYEAATSAARIDPQTIREPAAGAPDTRPENPTAYISGLGGVITELKLTPEFFTALDAQIAAEETASGKHFRTLSFTQAFVSVYFPGGRYNWEEIDADQPGSLISEMNAAPSSLGLYSDYKRPSAVIDYAYGYSSSYGALNRSHGCYRMEITSHLQQVWNRYTEVKQAAAAEGREVDWEQVPLRTLYLGPALTDRFSNAYTLLQGESSAENQAPIRFEMAYNLIQ